MKLTGPIANLRLYNTEYRDQVRKESKENQKLLQSLLKNNLFDAQVTKAKAEKYF